MKILRIILGILILIFVFFLIKWAVNPNMSPEWTGFGAYDESKQGVRAKTLWDWLDLLVIPVVLAVIAWLYKEHEKFKNKNNEKTQRQNQALDDFIKIITDLNLNHGLATTSPKDGTKEIARSRVILILESIEGERKGEILQFLYESKLIDMNPKLVLFGANFNKIQLSGIDLSEAEIRGAYFIDSDIQNVNIDNSIFIGCNFKNSNFSKSKVYKTDFSYSNLSGCLFNDMDLSSVNFEGANLSKADFSDSIVTQKQSELIKTFDGIKNENLKII